ADASERAEQTDDVELRPQLERAFEQQERAQDEGRDKARDHASQRIRHDDLPDRLNAILTANWPANNGCWNCVPLSQVLHQGPQRDFPAMQPTQPELWHGTTILTVRKG